MYNDDEFIDLVIERLDVYELIDILSPETEDIINGLKPLVLEKRDKIEDFLELEDYLEGDDYEG